MRDEFDEPQPALESTTSVAEVAAAEAPAPLLPQVPASIRLLNRDFLSDVSNIPDG